MKLVVAGGRDRSLCEADLARLDEIHAAEGVSELVSGGAKGVDREAEAWAKSRGIPVRQFKPDWKRFRRGAGPVRNRDMAHYADAVAVFPGGAGTRNMLQEAKRAGKRVFNFMDEVVGPRGGACPHADSGASRQAPKRSQCTGGDIGRTLA